MTIQWFPGHMAKARRQIQEQLKLIDVVIELLDARIPLSSRNPMIDEILAGKPRLVLLNKADLADPAVSAAWSDYFKEKSLEALSIDSVSGNPAKAIVARCKQLSQEKIAQQVRKGIRPRAIRALVVGIPNVGKSTLINRLANRKIAATGDKPGVTKSQQWIKVGTELELLDTPGILWPKFEDPEVGLRLAATGAIKAELLHADEIALFVLRYLGEWYPRLLQERFSLPSLPTELTDPEQVVAVIDEIGRKRGCMQSGGTVDLEKASSLILRDLRAGTIGRISLESP